MGRVMRRWILVGLALLMAGPLAGQERIGDVVFVRKSDPVTRDDKSQVLSVEEGRKIGIVFTCPNRRPVVFLQTHKTTFFRGGGAQALVEISFRFDDGEYTEGMYWQLDPSNRALIRPFRFQESWYDGWTLDFIAKAKAARNVVARVRDLADGVVVDGILRPSDKVKTFEFSMMGLTKALGRVPCGIRM